LILPLFVFELCVVDVFLHFLLERQFVDPPPLQ